MQLQTLKAMTRDAVGKGPVGRLRSEGAIPAVLYGGDQDPVSIQVNALAFTYLLDSHAGEHAVVQLEVENKPELNTPALLKLVQHHPVQEEVLHADFLRVRLDQRIVTRVPIRCVGHAAGVREGGVLDHILRELEIESLVVEVPETIDVDVADLLMGDSVHAGQLTLPENVTLVTDPEHTVVAVHTPRVVEVAEEAEVAEGEEAEVAEGEEAEPEVIGEKKAGEEKA